MTEIIQLVFLGILIGIVIGFFLGVLYTAFLQHRKVHHKRRKRDLYDDLDDFEKIYNPKNLSGDKSIMDRSRRDHSADEYRSETKPAYMCGIFVFLYLDLLLLFYRNICCQITMRWFNINKIIIQHMKSAKKEFNSFCFYFAIRIQHDLHTIAMWCSINS